MLRSSQLIIKNVLNKYNNQPYTLIIKLIFKNKTR
jgi:hypothetical protein